MGIIYPRLSCRGCATTHRTGGPPVPKRRFHVQWVHIGMQGPGVCIRKISGFVKVTSGSRRTKVRSQIFYVRTSEGHALPYRGFQLPPCPGALSVSALRAGALALAPTCTVLRAGRGPGPTWHPARALVPIWGGRGPGRASSRRTWARGSSALSKHAGHISSR